MKLTKDEYEREFKQIEKITKYFIYNPNKNGWYYINIINPNTGNIDGAKFIINRCKFCNTLFMSRCRNNRLQKFCSYSCKAKQQWKDPELRKMRSEKTKQQWKDPEFRKMMSEMTSEKAKQQWKDPKFRKMMSEMQSEKFKQKWKDPEFRKIHMELWRDPEFRKMHSEMMSEKNKQLWKDPEFRKMMSEKTKQLWKDPVFRTQVSVASKCNQKVTNEILKEKYPQKYKEYRSLVPKRDKTRQDIIKMYELWDEMYYGDSTTLLRIKQEVKYNIEQMDRPMPIDEECLSSLLSLFK